MRLLLLVILATTGLAVVSSENNCKFPGAPAHSSVTFTNDSLPIGAIATYSCERGFELLGPARRVCETTGEWLPEGIPFCVLNVAAGKAPMQISSEPGGLPQKAIDGSTSSFFSPETCTLTKPERTPWWYVNLLEPYMVQLVRLDFGKACCGKNKPATIIVRVGNNRPDLGTNPICNRFTGFIDEGKPLFLPCNPPMPGAFVSVHMETAGASTQLSICEAFVYTDQALPIERCPQFRDQPPGSTATYNGKCYIFYNRQPMNLRESLAFCRSRGGTLVDESNPALQGFVSWELWRRHRSDSQSQYWMGAVRDSHDRNNWKWLNGDDLTVSFWSVPANGPESNSINGGDCARFDGAKGWLWSDTNCNAQLNYICQHQPNACGRPEQPPNSTMIAENFNVGTVVEYTCDEGHLLIGPSTRTCLATGFYNEFPPVCKRIQCGYPAEISNGSYKLINGTINYLSQVQYNCSEGFKMTGRDRLICDLDERWDGPPPKCSVQKCEDPPIISNGEYQMSNNDSIVGTIVEYSCVSRKFRLVGTKELICLPNGQYDNKPPYCKEEIKTPPAPILVTKPPSSATSTTPSSRVTPSREKPRPFTTRPTIVTKPSNDHDDNGQTSSNVVIASAHPHDNEIPDSVHVRTNPNAANIPNQVESEHRIGPKLNLGAIIALGVFGAFVFLAAVVTTIVILVKRNRSAKHFRHRASPDTNTVASLDSSESESRGGLNRYYRQAWENLHQSAVSPKHSRHHHHHHHQTNRRKETMDPSPRMESMRDGSELVVNDAYHPRSQDKKRHHHHHHHQGRPSNRY
ncbi:uncharacterized protein LOC126906135 [Daktulosphaira vitifoliae]|uniref:uncharacterized protein LOC126906135 n=1 Tax=Daktulosphaira vitifoliae TaxID=58002 RepID=UPI0021AAF6FB|nr:uncharacterized protein LOC126906135 [Daktulosphaira vitifoliae]